MADEANVFSDSFEFEFRGVRTAGVAKQAGAEELGASVYELQPGARWADLHFHYRNEELIIVLAGRPTLHTLEGSRELAEGEVAAFLRGRRGAHRLENRSDAVARVLIVSTMAMPEVVEYPDEGRAFVMTEPPYSGAPLDESVGRLVRVFEKSAGRPVPPDEGD